MYLLEDFVFGQPFNQGSLQVRPWMRKELLPEFIAFAQLLAHACWMNNTVHYLAQSTPSCTSTWLTRGNLSTRGCQSSTLKLLSQKLVGKMWTPRCLVSFQMLRMCPSLWMLGSHACALGKAILSSFQAGRSPPWVPAPLKEEKYKV